MSSRPRSVRSTGRAFLTPVRWIAGTLAMLVVTSILVFGMVALFPGDPAESVLSNSMGRRPTPEEVAAKRHELGLDRPVLEQYATWASHAVRGDFGTSWTEPARVSDLLLPRVAATMLLGVTALILGFTWTVLWGVVSAVRAGGLVDHGARVFSVVIASMPAFVIGLLVLQYVVIKLQVGSVLTDGTWRTVALPALVLGTTLAAAWIRPFRSVMMDSLAAPFSWVARARGLGQWRVAFVVALPVAVVEFLPFIGLALGALLGATILVEVVFAWPGAGGLAVEAAQRRDVPTIQAFTLLSVVLFRLSVDAVRGVHGLADPRRKAGAR